MAIDEKDGRVNGPTTAALAALALVARSAARRSLAFAIRHRGLPLPNATDPDRRYGWGWTTDTRSLVEPTARVLLAVNARTPENDAVRDEAVAFMRERQCADGGWNFGNASVYDVDLKSYPQTTAVALIALQGEPADLVRPALRYLRRGWRLEPGGLTLAQTLVAFRLHGEQASARGPARCSRGPRDAAGLPSPSACRRVGRSRDGARRAPRAVEVAGVSLTRRQLLVRAGVGAAWLGAGGAIAAERLGVVRPAAPVRSLGVPRAGTRGRRRPARGELRRRPRGPAARRAASRRAGRPRPLGAPQAEPRRVRGGLLDQHRPAARRRRSEHACAGWARPRSSWPKVPGIAATPRP